MTSPHGVLCVRGWAESHLVAIYPREDIRRPGQVRGGAGRGSRAWGAGGGFCSFFEIFHSRRCIQKTDFSVREAKETIISISFREERFLAPSFSSLGSRAAGSNFDVG